MHFKHAVNRCVVMLDIPMASTPKFNHHKLPAYLGCAPDLTHHVGDRGFTAPPLRLLFGLLVIGLDSTLATFYSRCWLWLCCSGDRKLEMSTNDNKSTCKSCADNDQTMFL